MLTNEEQIYRELIDKARDKVRAEKMDQARAEAREEAREKGKDALWAERWAEGWIEGFLEVRAEDVIKVAKYFQTTEGLSEIEALEKAKLALQRSED